MVIKSFLFPDTYFVAGTVIYREYSTDVGDPYYPVPNKRNKELYAKYQVCVIVSSQPETISDVSVLKAHVA